MFFCSLSRCPLVFAFFPHTRRGDLRPLLSDGDFSSSSSSSSVMVQVVEQPVVQQVVQQPVVQQQAVRVVQQAVPQQNLQYVQQQVPPVALALAPRQSSDIPSLRPRG